MKKIFFLIAVTIIAIAPGIRAQKITRVSPDNITLRAVSLGSLWTALTVGDSGYVAFTHATLSATSTWVLSTSGLDPSIMLYAVAYAGDTLHAAIAGTQGWTAWTSDGGISWNHVQLPTGATIRALTWNKSTTTNVLEGVGDGGLVIRSTDQGKSWNTIASTTTAQLNAISFGTTTDAVAVGNDTTLIQTHDAGQTWAPMAFPYDMYLHIWDSLFKLSSVNTFNFTGVAMCGADSVWVGLEQFTTALLINHGAIDTNHGVVTNAGPIGTFPVTEHTSLLYIGMPPFLDVISLTTSDYIIYDTGQQIWYTRQLALAGDADGNVDLFNIRMHGGAVWKEDTTLLILMVGEELSVLRYIWSPHVQDASQPLAHFPGGITLPGRPVSIDFLDVNILPNGYGYAVGTYAILERTTDSGRSWTYIPTPIYHTNVKYDSSFDGVYTIDSSTAILTGWDGPIYRVAQNDSGFRAVGLAQQYYLEGIAFPSKDTCIVVGDEGTVLQSTDQGVTWQSITTPTSEHLYSVAFMNQTIGVAVGTYGEIIRTTDEGNTWQERNNEWSGEPVTYRQVQGFPDGTFFARADSYLMRSTDSGQRWEQRNLPYDSDTAGMSFYSPEIGIIAGPMTSSALVPDTAYLAYTSDGGTTWPLQFTVPMWASERILFHWLSDHEVLLYGTDGFIEDVNFSESGVSVTQINQTQDFSIYPNPSSGEISIDYTSKTSGPVAIELCDETGRTVKTLFTGEEGAGGHEHTLDISKEARGAYFVRLTRDGKASVAPVSEE